MPVAYKPQDPTPAFSPNPTEGDLLTRVNNILNACSGIKTRADDFRARRIAKKTYTTAIGSSDRFYYQVQRWLVREIEVENQHNVRVTGDGSSLRFMFDDSQSQIIRVDGHPIAVSSQKPKRGKGSDDDDLAGVSDNLERLFETQLVFIARSQEGFEALAKKLLEIRTEATRSRKEPPLIHYSTDYYGEHSTQLRSRSIDSVVLTDGQMERIVADLERFLNDEKVYLERGIPYQRGYLFHGDPGTGKTSLAKALAAHFDMDVFYISLGSISGDQQLNKALSRVSEKSIALFEDVDVFSGVKDRDETKEHTFTLSGMLNALDGILTPHGMVKILTTNHIEALDPALLRPGRLDMVEKLGYLEGKMADKMFYAFYGEQPSTTFRIEGISPATMMEVLKTNMYDPQRAEEELREKFER